MRVAAAVAERRGRPLADAVERQDGGLVERRREKRAGRVRLVMIGEDDAAVVLRRQAPRRSSRGRCSFDRSHSGSAVR